MNLKVSELQQNKEERKNKLLTVDTVIHRAPQNVPIQSGNFG